MPASPAELSRYADILLPGFCVASSSKICDQTVSGTTSSADVRHSKVITDTSNPPLCLSSLGGLCLSSVTYYSPSNCNYLKKHINRPYDTTSIMQWQHNYTQQQIRQGGRVWWWSFTKSSYGDFLAYKKKITVIILMREREGIVLQSVGDL